MSPKRGGAAPIAIAALATNTKPSVVQNGLKALTSAIVSPAAAATAADANGNYSVQIGAYRKRSLAERRLKAIENLRRPANLNRAAPSVSVRNAGGRPLYRARFVGMAKVDADRACQRLKAKSVDCFVVIEN